MATEEADVAYGSDTGGSVRIPSACCGTAGLKTTWGRIPLDGVWPLAPSFDTVGPMARDVAGLVTGMELLEPGIHRWPTCRCATSPSAGCPSRPIRAITAAIDRALKLVGWECTGRCRCRGGTTPPCRPASSWWSRRGIPTPRWWRRTPRASATTCAARLQLGSTFDDGAVRAAWLAQRDWKATLERVFAEVDILVTPTLTIFPPRLEDGDDLLVSRCTLPVNLAGVPALSLPVPTAGPLPASIQLIGPAHSEERLLAAGALLEAAVAAG